MAKQIKQSRLMNEWGCEFFGEAHLVGGVWVYYQPQDDGTTKTYPLLPMEYELGYGEDDHSGGALAAQGRPGPQDSDTGASGAEG